MPSLASRVDAGNLGSCQVCVRRKVASSTCARESMQSSNLTRAVLGTLADAYPTAIAFKKLAVEVRCEPEALHKHLWLLHDMGAVQARGHGAVLESASITDAGLSLVRSHSDALAPRSRVATRH
jgi:hypothetical protein